MKIHRLLVGSLLLICMTHAYAGFDDGIAAYQIQNYPAAMKEWKLLADKGDARAQNCIGTMYLNGYGAKKNYAKAMQWYWSAAEQGDAEAQANIGVMYFYGYSVKTDYSEALRWYQTAASKGSAWAMTNIGLMYGDGSVGVAKDYAEAMRWFRKAVEQETTQNKFSMEQGVAWAQFNIGRMYEQGHGVSKDYKEALRWYLKSAEHGLTFAQEYVGMMYDFPIGVQQNYAEALKWYKQAAAQGSASAKKRIEELAKIKPSSDNGASIISSEIRSKDGGATIHLGYEIGTAQVGSITISLPAGYLFCNPRTSTNTSEFYTCPSDLHFRFNNSDTESLMTFPLPSKQRSVVLSENMREAFLRVWDHTDKYSLVAYDQHGDKFLIEFFKQNLTNNYINNK
ncbi:MAG: tetratricopeptide repeat protein [Sideroxydans sp.]|nr:tetratricopeptide repeat protein [Sideroxydans sp.]